MLLAAAAVLLPRPLPRRGPALVALLALAGLTAWTALSLTWAPLGEPAGEDVQRLLGYVAALAASIAILREPAAARLAEPLLLAGTTGAILYGLSERLLPGRSTCSTCSARAIAWHSRSPTGTPRAGSRPSGWCSPPGSRARASARPRSAPPPRPPGRCSASALYLTFSRGALGALAAGLAVLLALQPTRAQLRAVALVAAGGALAALATAPLPAVATAKSGSGQGAAMLAVLRRCSPPPPPSLQHRGRDAGQGALPRVRTLARGRRVALALVATAVLVAQVERGDAATARPRARPGWRPCRATATPTGRSRCARSATTR